jgi:uncharacterized damage-inducible protein DinB
VHASPDTSIAHPTTAHLAKLLEHMAWADARLLDGLRAEPRVDADVLELYAHVLGAEHVWLARLRQRPAEVAVWPTLTLDECAALSARNIDEYRAFLASLGPGDPGREVPYRNSAGDAFRSTVEDILLQVALHGSYHRGQIARAVRLSGGTPTPTDYIAWVRGAPAATRVGR